MKALSPAYEEINRLRSSGAMDAAMAALRAHRPTGDADAFEAVVCLFISGDVRNALHVCRTHAWKEQWARQVTGALAERIQSGDAARALALARAAARSAAAPHDAVAIYLLLLQETGGMEEAQAYVAQRYPRLPLEDTFLLTVLAELAVAAGDWRRAYRAASAVLAADPDDYRALLAASMANSGIGNFHEALGTARRAILRDKGSVAATLQIMRCENRLGDYYAVLEAFDAIESSSSLSADVRVELGAAYAGLGDQEQAIANYNAALESDPTSMAAIRALISIHATARDRPRLDAFVARHGAAIERDIECLYWLGLAALHRGDVDAAADCFERTRRLAEDAEEALHELPWPVPGSRVRHDCEQLDLLERRGRLSPAGRDALSVLRHYYAATEDPQSTVGPSGNEGQALRSALCTTYYMPGSRFDGRALGDNDFGEIEKRYFAERIVVIDDFLSPAALAELRAFCEEATIWKVNNDRGYVGAVLAQGFSARVLLELITEIPRALPRVIGDYPLLQAWGFKYDQRMQGINMHADFAKVNINFWITPDEACADPQTGGLVVYDAPVPQSWTFADYNTRSDKLRAYLRVHDAKPKRVPYRANRCVLFDSSLIHVTDELHFRPGYGNRRVNVTLLYGRARAVE